MFPRFARNGFVGLGAHSRLGDLLVTNIQAVGDLPVSSTFWSKRVNRFRFFVNHSLYHGFRSLHHTNYLALTQFTVTRRTLSHDSCPAHGCLRLVALSGTHFIQSLGSPGDTGGFSVFASKHHLLSDLVSHAARLRPRHK